MAKKPDPNDRQTVLQCVRDLAAAAQVDTVHRDLLLQRAIVKLRTVLPETTYREASELEPRTALLLAESRRAVDRQDWVKVKSISVQVEEFRRKLQEAAAELEVAKQVYEAPSSAEPAC